MTPANRSYALAVCAVFSGVGALVATSLFVLNLPEPQPGSDGFVHGLAAAGAILFGLQGLVVVTVGVTLAGLEAVDVTTTRQRLVAQASVVLATVGPPLVLVWAHLDGPSELTGASFVSVSLGTLLVVGLCTWVFVTAVARRIRATVG